MTDITVQSGWKNSQFNHENNTEAEIDATTTWGYQINTQINTMNQVQLRRDNFR